MEDYSVDMKEYYAEVDADISEQYEEQVDVDEDDEQVDLDGFKSLIDSDGDTTLERACRSVRKDKIRSKTSGECPFYLGQSFPDKDNIKMMVKNHAIDSRRQLHITRNDNTRFRVICTGGIPKWSSCEINAGGPSQPTALKGKSGNTQNATGPSQVGTTNEDVPNPKNNTPPTCPWMLYVSKVKKAGSWVVKTLNKEHVCLNTRDVRLCTVAWLSKKIQHTVKNNPGIPLKALQEDLQRKYQVEVTLHQVFRAMMKATEKVQGHYGAQYENLRNYCEELLRTNLGSTVKIDVEPVAILAVQQGRPILGLDGCFLKGPFPGQILTAVGVDGNNGIYPVAYAVVEAETTASWTWFLQCLGDDLELEHNSRARCDILLNNICEVFNRQLIQGRDKPIITCLEYIREYLMKKIVVVNNKIGKCKSPLTTAATAVLQTAKTEAAEYIVIWTGGTKFQVSTHFNDHQDQRVVILDERTCSCRRWDLTGIPCRHAVACIWNMGLHGKGDGVPEKWPKSACPTTLIPPRYHVQIRRPKKKRKKSAQEIAEAKVAASKEKKKAKVTESVENVSNMIPATGKLPRKGGSVTCKICKGVGHNKRTCGKSRRKGVQAQAGAQGQEGAQG
ncbi:uncharacterized protein LOC110933462 [Helianthus annuus]|uniref:uncharacterized protein LOC110933462 n=1 Tax=Helianthus annuus TaxID=4232 RepID=UPI0016530949|nr:uncharacterized protein LOC110933462 [Helianthus annuus]